MVLTRLKQGKVLSILNMILLQLKYEMNYGNLTSSEESKCKQYCIGAMYLSDGITVTLSPSLYCVPSIIPLTYGRNQWEAIEKRHSYRKLLLLPRLALQLSRIIQRHTEITKCKLGSVESSAHREPKQTLL